MFTSSKPTTLCFLKVIFKLCNISERRQYNERIKIVFTAARCLFRFEVTTIFSAWLKTIQSRGRIKNGDLLGISWNISFVANNGIKLPSA